MPDESRILATRALKNLRLAGELFDFCYRVKRHQLQLQRPDVVDAALHREVMRLIEAASA